MPRIRAEQMASLTMTDAQIAVNAAISQSKIANLLSEPDGWISKGMVTVLDSIPATPTSGSQGFGLNINPDNDCGLQAGKTYYFKINTKEYSISPTGPMSYTQLASAMDSIVSVDNFSVTIGGTDLVVTNKATGYNSTVNLNSETQRLRLTEFLTGFTAFAAPVKGAGIVWSAQYAGRFFWDKSTDELWMGTSAAPDYRYLVTGPNHEGFAESQDLISVVKMGSDSTDSRTFSFSPQVFSVDGSDSFVYLNGALQTCGVNDDYIVVDTSTIKFNFDIASDDRVSMVIITVAYMSNYATKSYVGSTASPSGASRVGVKSIGNIESVDVQSALEELQGDIDKLSGGENLVFTLNQAYKDGSTIQVDVNDVDWQLAQNKIFKVSDGTGSLASSGYQDVLIGGDKSVSDLSGLNSNTKYYLKINGIEYEFTTSNSTIYSSIIVILNSEITGFKFDIVGGNFRVTNKITGAGSTVTLTAPVSSPSMWTTLTGYSGFGIAVVGKDSIASNPLLEVASTTTSNQVNAYVDIIPSSEDVDLGNTDHRFGNVWAKTAHFDTNTVYLGDTNAIKIQNGKFAITTDGGNTYSQIVGAPVSGSPTTVQAAADQSLNMSTSGAGVVSISSASSVGITAPELNISGNILPTVDNTQNIGSPELRFNNIYANEVHVGASSLYVNGKKVIEDVSSTMTFATDPDQGINIKTSGLGDISLISGDQIVATSDGEMVYKISATNPSKNMQFTNQSVNGQILFNSLDQIDMTATLLDIHGNESVSGTLTAASLVGPVTGNASSATKLATARTLSLAGDASGSASFDGSADASITVVVADNSHNHTSANISDATDLNTASTIVKRDASGNFSAGTITANLTGNASGSSGSCTGNAATATRLATSRTLNLTGSATGSASFNGNADASITVTIVDNSHNHTSANISDATNANTANMIVKRDASGGFSAGPIVATDLTIAGNLTVNGTTTSVNTTNIDITDNIVVLNKNQTGTPLSTLTSGIEIERGDSTNYQFLFRESDDTFAIGLAGSLQAVATRQDSPTANAIPYWNSSDNRFDSSGVTVSGSTLTGNLTGNASGSSGSCTGNSATATKLATARTLSLAGDASGSASFDGSADASITVVVADNSHNHTSANISDATNLNTASTIVKRDASGNFSAGTITATTFSGALSGNASTATTATNVSGGTVSATSGSFSSAINQTVSADEAHVGCNYGSYTFYMYNNSGAYGLFSNDGSIFAVSHGSNAVSFGGTVTASTFSGALSGNATTATTATTASACSGNAATATKLATARTIALSSDVTGSASFDGSGNITITATVADNSHNHTSANISDATNANTASTIVKRDASGGFSAGTISATFSGALSGNASTATALASAGTLTINGSSGSASASSANGNYTISISGCKVNNAGNADTVTTLTKAQIEAQLTGTITTHTHSSLTSASYVQSTGYSTSWNVSNGTSTGAYNAIMGTGSAATWLVSGTSGGTFRGGIQLLDAGGTMYFNTGSSSTVSVSGSTITGSLSGNATTATTASSANAIRGINCHADTTAPTGVNQLNIEAYLYATRVYNAVWNDLAEFMPKCGDSEAGDVLVMTDDGVKKSDQRAAKAVIGVYSDTFGYALGAEDQDNKVPVGLAGRVKVKVREPLEIGDLLVSDSDGFATKATSSEELRAGIILGKVVERKSDSFTSRIWMLVLNR